MMLCSGGGRSWVVPHTGGEQPLRAGRESRWGGEEVINECPIAALPLEGGHRGAWGWLWWPGLVVPMQRGCSRVGGSSSRWGHSAHAFRGKSTCWGCCYEGTVHGSPAHAPPCAGEKARLDFP